MKIRVARPKDWIPIPAGSPRVKQCCSSYQLLFGERPLPIGKTRQMATAMLDFHVARMELEELKVYRAFVQRIMARLNEIKRQTSPGIVRKKREKKL